MSISTEKSEPNGTFYFGLSETSRFGLEVESFTGKKNSVSSSSRLLWRIGLSSRQTLDRILSIRPRNLRLKGWCDLPGSSPGLGVCLPHTKIRKRQIQSRRW